MIRTRRHFRAQQLAVSAVLARPYEEREGRILLWRAQVNTGVPEFHVPGPHLPKSGWRGVAALVSTVVVVAAAFGVVATEQSAGAQGGGRAGAADHLGAGRVAGTGDVDRHNPVKVPAALQRAIDKTLATQPVSSPGGVTLSWGRDGTVTFHRANGLGGSFALRPESFGRTTLANLTAGQFVFGPKSTTESLGHGVSAWYKVETGGIEQGFTLTRRPSGTTGTFSIVLGYSGPLHANRSGPRRLTFSSPSGPVMSYGDLRVTDVTGKVLPSHLVAGPGQVRIVVNDVGAVYPLKVDPYVAPLSTPAAAVLTGTHVGNELGTTVALSAGGNVALVGAPSANSDAGAAYIYQESAGNWSTTPSATLSGTSDQQLGSAVAVSANGQAALVGAPGDSLGNGAAFLYTESPAGTWSTGPTASFVSTSFEHLGSSVALSAKGNAVLLGAPYTNSGEGSAVLYEQQPNGNWPTNASTTFRPSSGSTAQFGVSVALSADGQTALVGAPLAGASAGAAFLYSESGGSWPSSATASFSGGGVDELGSSVALSGDGQAALVGAPGTSAGAGEAFLFDESAGAWPTTPAASFTGSPSSDEQLGASVALSADGQSVLVGAPGANAGNGSAFVYAESDGGWPTSPVTTLTGSQGAFGTSVALSASGEVALVGAPLSNDSTGAAYIYAQPALSWSTAVTATFPGVAGSGEELGDSVALSADGQTALVGAPFLGGDEGAAYLYTQSAGSWTTSPVATFTGSSKEYLGWSVALSADGQTALIGAPDYNSLAGAAYVYRQSAGAWLTSSPSATFTGGAGGDELGSSVALSAAGEVALVGAPEFNSQAGAAYVYTESSGSWSGSPSATWQGSATERLGASVALSADGQTALVGAPSASSDAGAAYIYTESAGNWPGTPGATFTGASGGEFGYSVALSADGQTALVGAPFASSDAGGAYIYTESAGSWPSGPAATFTAATDDLLGGSVALSANGQAALIGLPGVGLDASFSAPGAANLYTESAGSWPSSPTVTYSGASTDSLGSAVALAADDQTALIGAPLASSYDGAAFVYTAGATVNVEVSGSQTYGSSSPTLAYTDDAPSGLSVTGTPTCSTVNLGTAIDPSLAAGSYTVDGSNCTGLSLSGPGASNYIISYSGATAGFVVNPAPLTITASDATMTYGGTVPTITPVTSGLVNGDTASSLAGLSCATNATASSPAGDSYTSSCSGATDPNYTISYVGGKVTVTPASLTISPLYTTMTYGGAVPAITPVYNNFVNGDNASSLTTTPVCSTNATSSSAAGNYTSSCSGASDPNYTFTYVQGTVVVQPAPLTVNASSASMIVGSPAPTITPVYSGFVNGDTASSLTTAPTCSTDASSSSSVGTYVSSCSGAADPNYNISYVDGSVTVNPVPPPTSGVVTVDVAGSQVYGSSKPTFTYTDNAPTGLDVVDNGLACTSVETASAIDPALTASSYTVDGSTCSGLSLSGTDAAGFTISYSGASGGFVVNQAPLFVTASSPSVTYGEPVPTITASYSGFVDGDTATSPGFTAPLCATNATSSSKPGTYTSFCTQGGDADYTFSYQNGAVDITPALLVVTASSASMTYGGTVPTITPSYNGFVNGDTSASLTTPPTCSTTATGNSTPGSYQSVCSGAQDPDYQIGYGMGTVTVTPAPLSITASSVTVTYGQTVPAITPSYSGFVNGDTPSSALTQEPQCFTTATSSSRAGSYGSSCLGAVGPDYAITYQGGTVTIKPAALAIKASSGSMTYGGTVPTITPSYSGFVNGDAASSLTTPPICSTTATGSSPAGTYASLCSGAVDPNYTMSYTDGTVTVNAAAVMPSAPAVAAPPTTLSSGTTSSGTTSTTTAKTTTTTAKKATKPGPASNGSVNAPLVSSLSPAKGPDAGGTVVVIKGKFLHDADNVLFGSHVAFFQVVSADEIRAISPAGAGTVSVVVKATAGNSGPSKAGHFTYMAKSQVLSLSPAYGPKAGGTTVVIHGSGFNDVSKVSFGSHAATFVMASSGTIWAISPPGTGTVDVHVSTPLGSSAKTKSDHFTYKATSVTKSAIK